jgi:hypothetical protein
VRDWEEGQFGGCRTEAHKHGEESDCGGRFRPAELGLGRRRHSHRSVWGGEMQAMGVGSARFPGMPRAYPVAVGRNFFISGRGIWACNLCNAECQRKSTLRRALSL